jgi:hypothetical protein
MDDLLSPSGNGRRRARPRGRLYRIGPTWGEPRHPAILQGVEGEAVHFDTRPFLRLEEGQPPALHGGTSRAVIEIPTYVDAVQRFLDAAGP